MPSSAAWRTRERIHLVDGGGTRLSLTSAWSPSRRIGTTVVSRYCFVGSDCSCSCCCMSTAAASDALACAVKGIVDWHGKSAILGTEWPRIVGADMARTCARAFAAHNRASPQKSLQQLALLNLWLSLPRRRLHRCDLRHVECSVCWLCAASVWRLARMSERTLRLLVMVGAAGGSAGALLLPLMCVREV